MSGVLIATAAIGAASSIYSSKQQSSAAKRQANIAESQARQQAAAQREQARSDALARKGALEAADADRLARANEEDALSEQTPVTLDTDVQSSASRRRRVQQTFGTGNSLAPSSVIRV